MKKLLLTLLLATGLFASPAIHKTEINQSIKDYYPLLKKSIQDNHMNVLYELDLLDKFKKSGYAEKFGKSFNRNNIEAIKTLLLCNGFVGNQVSNIDPDMMVLCPIKITLIQSNGKTTVTFIKSADMSPNEEVAKLLKTLDQVIVNTIELTHDKYMDQAAANIGPYDSQFEGN